MELEERFAELKEILPLVDPESGRYKLELRPTVDKSIQKLDPMAVPPDDSDKRFEKESFINASPERVFGFHERPDALKLLIPPWINAKVVKAAKISELGSKTTLELRLLGIIKTSWQAQHTSYKPMRAFTDVQIKGPFRSWRHRHSVRPDGVGTRLKDEISYQPPFGWFGRLLTPLIERRLKRVFDYRHEVTRNSCEETEEGKKDLNHA